MKHLLNKIIPTVVTVSMLACVPVSAYEKSETVYTKVDTDGKVTYQVVSEHLTSSKKETIKDYSDLSNITNTSGNEKMTQDGNNVDWQSKGDDIFYTGKTSAELPISVTTSYELDGQKVDYKDAKGKKGHVVLTFKYKNNQKHSYKGETVYTPFLTLLSTSFDSTKNKNVKVNNGKVVNNGKSELVVGLALPGMHENFPSVDQLDGFDTIKIEFDTTDFDLNSIYSVASPKLLDSSKDEDDITKIFDQVDDKLDSLDELESATEKLVSGTSKLSTGAKTLANGTNSLSSGASTLANGANSLATGANTLATGSNTLANGTASAVSGAKKLANGAKTLANGTKTAQSGVKKIDSGAKKLQSKGTKKVASGAKTLSSSTSTLFKNVKSQASALSTQLSNSQTQLSTLKNYNTQAASSVTSATKTLNETITTLKSTGLSLDSATNANRDKAKQSLSQISADLTLTYNALEKLDTALKATDDTFQAQSISEEVTKIQTVEKELNTMSDSREMQKQLDQVTTSIPQLEEQVKDTKSATYPKDIAAKLFTLYEDKGKLEAGIQEAAQVKTLSASLSNEIKALNTITDKQDTSKTSTKISEVRKLIKDKMTEIQGYQKKIKDNEKIISNLGNLDVDSLVSKLNTLSGSLSSMNDLPTLLKQNNTAIDQLNSSLKQIDTSMNKTGKTQKTYGLVQALSALNDGASTLATGAQSVSDNYDKLVKGIDTLNSSFGKLVSGANQLSAGNSSLYSGAVQLNSGAQKLASGANTLANGANTLANGAGTLSSGATKVNTGAQTLASGANTLASSMKKYKTSGIDKLTGIADDLKEESDKYDQLKKYADDYKYTATNNDAKYSTRFVTIIEDKD